MRPADYGATWRGLATAVIALAAALAPAGVSRADEADARKILQTMSDYLAGQETFAFDYDATLEVVTPDDQTLGLASSGSVTVGRPDRIRATRSGGFAEAEMLFDGTTFTLLGKDAGRFTQVEVPGDIDTLVDALRDTYRLPLPAADLLVSDPYAALMGDVVDVKDLGSGVIGGQECDYLAFRGGEVDWQIWIAQGDRPYPCRYTITTSSMAQGPQYTVQIRDWRTGDAVAADDYAFDAAGATEVELEDLRAVVSDLPQHFTLGDGQ